MWDHSNSRAFTSTTVVVDAVGDVDGVCAASVVVAAAGAGMGVDTGSVVVAGVEVATCSPVVDVEVAVGSGVGSGVGAGLVSARMNRSPGPIPLRTARPDCGTSKFT